MTWQKAIELWREHDGPDDGFYLSREVIFCIIQLHITV